MVHWRSPKGGWSLPAERAVQLGQGLDWSSHWSTCFLCTQRAPCSQQSRGAQATTGPSQGLTMAFCLRALWGPDCHHCWCQPPGTPPPWSPHMPSRSTHLIALKASHLQLPLQDHGRLYVPWSPGFLICPTLGAPSPFLRRGCLPLFSSGFIDHRQWVWPCQRDPAPPLAFRQSHLAR